MLRRTKSRNHDYGVFDRVRIGIGIFAFKGGFSVGVKMEMGWARMALSIKAFAFGYQKALQSRGAHCYAGLRRAGYIWYLEDFVHANLSLWIFT
tara:strand:+ start:578 stop:859 length:282 start_codon:yes stop_codon:yes gene_type:complete